MRRRRKRRADRSVCDGKRIDEGTGPDPVVVDALAGLTIALPQPNKQPLVEEMLQAMNGSSDAVPADSDAGEIV